MDNLYDRIISLCEKQGISGYRLCKEINIQPSILTDLKMGRQKGLTAKNADKIASYFGISVGYLLGTEEQKAPTVSGECRNIIKIVGRDGSVVIKELTDEQLSAYKTMVDHLPEADDL